MRDALFVDAISARSTLVERGNSAMENRAGDLSKKPSVLRSAAMHVLPELVLNILPLIIVWIVVSMGTEGSRGVMASPEWSFGAAILFGQTLIRFVAGVLKKPGANVEAIQLFVAAVIVLGLTP